MGFLTKFRHRLIKMLGGYVEQTVTVAHTTVIPRTIHATIDIDGRYVDVENYRKVCMEQIGRKLGEELMNELNKDCVNIRFAMNPTFGLDRMTAEARVKVIPCKDITTDANDDPYSNFPWPKENPFLYFKKEDVGDV